MMTSVVLCELAVLTSAQKVAAAFEVWVAAESSPRTGYVCDAAWSRLNRVLVDLAADQDALDRARRLDDSQH